MAPEPEAYLHVKDRFAAQMLDWGIPWRFPCSDIDQESRPDLLWEEQCFRFGEQQRMQGLWRNGFEGSEFCPASAKECPLPADGSGARHSTWLQIKPKLKGWENTPPGGLYAIDFIGRRSKYLAFYGHLGMSDGEVIVDRLISIREIEPPPPEPTKAEVVKYWKECEAAGNCIPNWQEINSIEE